MEYETSSFHSSEEEEAAERYWREPQPPLDQAAQAQRQHRETAAQGHVHQQPKSPHTSAQQARSPQVSAQQARSPQQHPQQQQARSPQPPQETHQPSDQAPRPRVLVMVGISGAGKSTLAKRILRIGREQGLRWTRVCQDVLKTRGKCERAAREALAERTSIVIDRTNLTPTQRQTWIEIAEEFGIWPEAVVMTTTDDEARRRAIGRADHEGKVQGDEAVKVVNSQISLEDRSFPVLEEGFAHIYRSDGSEASAIAILSSEVDYAALQGRRRSRPAAPADEPATLAPFLPHQSWQAQPSTSLMRGNNNDSEERPADVVAREPLMLAPNVYAPVYYLSPKRKSPPRKRPEENGSEAEAKGKGQPRLQQRVLSFEKAERPPQKSATLPSSEMTGTEEAPSQAKPPAAARAARAATAAAAAFQQPTASWKCSVCGQFNTGSCRRCNLCLAEPPAAALDDEQLFGSFRAEEPAPRAARTRSKSSAKPRPNSSISEDQPTGSSQATDSDKREYLQSATQRWPSQSNGGARSAAAAAATPTWLWDWDSGDVCPVCAISWAGIKGSRQSHVKTCTGR